MQQRVAKTDVKSPQGRAMATEGVVLQIEDNNIALVRLRTGLHVRVRADMLRGKSAAPQPGEKWLFDQPYGGGWMFAIPMNYTGGDRDFIGPTMQNGWTSAGGAYLPVGYLQDAEGWVHLRGRVTGGTGGQSAFTLPEGYRPAGVIPFAVAVGTGVGLVSVTTLGAIVPATGADASLEQVSFLAKA